MDYSRVPGGALALRRLQEKHRDIHLSYDAALELHTLYGTYSKVQAALTQLFGSPGNQEADTGQRATSGSGSERLPRNLQVNPPEDLRANQQKEEKLTVDPLRSPPAEVASSRSQRELTPGAYGVEDTGRREGATPQLTRPPEEDNLLIVDADMFQYLQKYCQTEYQQILGLYGVEAVDVTNQGLTSVYLRSAAGAGENVRGWKTLSLARNAISQFFQENEREIWRAEFSKSIFSSGKVLQMAKDSVTLTYPMVLLKEDDTNVYMIGRSRDVCDAKRLFLGRSLDQCLKSEDDQTKEEVVRRWRLAPRFKESGLPPLGGRPTDFCLRGGPAAQSRPKCSGPMLGLNVLSEPAQTDERVPAAPPQITSEDIFFGSQSPSCPAASTPSNDASLHSGSIKSQPKAAAPSTSLQDSALAPAASGPALKRANSFSGTPQRKAQLTQQRSHDDANKPAARAGAFSSSPPDHPSKDRQAGHSAEVLVPSLMWQHMKEAYSKQVDDLTSDIQIRESTHGGGGSGGSVTVTLRGASPSKLKSSRIGLQKLIDSISGDFSVHKLPLSELGLTDPMDETLLACCHNVRNCFCTVTVQITTKRVLLLGPQLLCSQVATSLLSVFSKDVAVMQEQQDFSIPSTSKCNPATLVHATEGQRAEAMPERSAGGAGADRGTRANQSSFEETTHLNASVSQPRLCKEPVIKEKVKHTGTGIRTGHKSSVLVSKTGDNKRENDAKSVTFPEEDPSLSVKERLDSAHQRRNERADSEAEPLRWGIHGRMTSSKLNISILGHKNDSTIKITYYIPDGIQQVRSLV